MIFIVNNENYSKFYINNKNFLLYKLVNLIISDMINKIKIVIHFYKERYIYFLYIKIYNIIMYLIQPVLWIRLLWVSKRIPLNRKRWLERYGLYNKAIRPHGIILHAVSLGEVLLSMPLIHALRCRYPNIIITLTTMTVTGIELAESKYGMDYHFHCRYLPYDLFGAMKRFINQVQPKLVILIEKELWPNFLNILWQRNIPCVIANARMSSRSFLRYNKIGFFMSFIMHRITLIAAQHQADASRFLKLGCSENKLFVTGNLKFDIEINQDLSEKILFLKNNWVQKRQIWIASSTHSGEEILLLQAHKQLLKVFPNLLMILVPRHPERCVDVQNITKKIGLSYIMKSSNVIPTQAVQVVINDTIGELMLLYGIANIAFVGGSLVKHGGHNPLEPALYAIPILMGPHTFNFSDICIKLHVSGGLIIVTSISSIVRVISMLLQDTKICLEYGDRAIKVLKDNQGALQRLLSLLEKMI